ncbi:MAG: EAL domain-containing protein [Phycisphaeraceae bacterium]|mgnify:CR=1 FL=1|nr:EAL domain-containing protein [Phycisphaerae bacterium]MBX3391177.1 EAL domain-containing protein [Phycisphaeraceae bacterium]HRJ51043.1 EAL domain-containing protein [Phycisphaerales bacterium]
MSTGVKVPPLTVLYQPVVELESGRVVGAEALTRFHDPGGALYSPARDGLIDRIEADATASEHLMRELLAQIARDMIPLFDSRPHFYIGVNVPPSMLGSGVIKHIVQHLQLEPYLGRFLVEVTERQALTDLGRTALAASRALGARVAIDDFGTGQSGLHQLLGLEFDVLKIDRSQVQPIIADKLARRLLRGVVALGGSLRVKLTAEGVETRTQAMFLHAAGVDCGQGWYWSKALLADRFRLALDAGFEESVRWEDEPPPLSAGR